MTGYGWLLLLAIGIALDRATRGRRRGETRARLLEVLAQTTRRGAPLAPVVERMADEANGRDRVWILGIADSLKNGEALGEALANSNRKRVPVHVADAITAAEGTDRLPRTLEALVDEEQRALRRGHRYGVVLLYPALVLFFLTLSPGLWVIRRLEMKLHADTPTSLLPAVCLAIAGTIVIGLVFGSVLRRFGLIPRARLLASARLLRTVATLLGAGMPLGEALRRAGTASGHVWLAWRARRAGRDVDRGEAASDAWSRLGLPTFARSRLAAMDGSRLVTTLLDTAEVCERRHEAWTERAQQLMYPSALLVAGALVAVQFAEVFLFIGSVQETLW